MASRFELDEQRQLDAADGGTAWWVLSLSARLRWG